MSTNIPGDGWTGFARLNPNIGDLYERIRTVLTSADFRELEKRALLARRRRDEIADPELSCTIDPSFFTNGSENVVLKVCFSDHVNWVARIYHKFMDDEAAQRYTVSMISEIATIKKVRECTTIPAPDVFAYDTDPSNLVGYPYMLMELLDGRALERSVAISVPPEHLPKVARQLADVLYQLQTITSKSLGQLWYRKDGDEPVSCVLQRPVDASSLEWFQFQRQENNRQAMQTNPQDPEWTTACWVLKNAVTHFIVEDRIKGPFPLCHLDLHYGNLLFDADYNLTGVIDWSRAQMVPFERSAISPEFVTAPAAPEERNNKILTLRSLVREHLQHLEEAESSSSDDGSSDGSPKTRLSEFFGTKKADMVYRCTYSFPYRALYDGRMVAELIYGGVVSWGQLVRVYGGQEIV
ncbi:hypothetical protein SLS62_000683 [Diatrype stigma]|uniref:Aminoglycoside phosphotransferase domain-containing protein n=1 Tax=Diatrype stigma TaxID=117547 RepID=A0AAN9V081_9PEZI